MTLKKVWKLKKTDKKMVEILTKELGVSSILAQLLINRGYENKEKAKYYLEANFDDLASPFEISGVSEATKRLKEAINKNEKIIIYGDYDVDGITSTTLLMQVLTSLGADVSFYIPDRISEGYGLNIGALKKIADDKVSLVVTVDCGISSSKAITEAKDFGLDFIVTDHHQPPEDLPPCIIINPILEEKEIPWKDLAGVGVAFKLAQGLLELFYGTSIGKEKSLEYLDLVALGTIADIVPLRGENRILVKQGLQEIKKAKRLGLKALSDVSNIDLSTISSGQIGFGIAPRLNACGRIGNPCMGVNLLLTLEEDEAIEIANNLNLENQNRQSIEARITKEAIKMAGEIDFNKQKVIILSSSDWHPGVIGIVASRLVEKYFRPTILLTVQNGLAKGSGRSIPGFHLYKALTQCQEILETFGGHSQAAGVSMKEENVAEFKESMNNIAITELSEEDLMPSIILDGEIDLQKIDFQLHDEISRLEPFGSVNPEPLLIYRRSEIKESRQVGNDGGHLKLKIKAGNGFWNAIGFNMGPYMEIAAGKEPLDLAFTLDKNHWNGKTELQLRLKDLKPYKNLDNPYEKLGFLDRIFIEGEKYLKEDAYKNINNKDAFYTKVVGVTYEERQETIKNLIEGATIELTREPDNIHDPYAIAILSKGEKIGYLKKEIARNLAKNLDEGVGYQGIISQVTGGEETNYGVNIYVKKDSYEDHNEQNRLMEIRREISLLPNEEMLDTIKESIIGNLSYRPKQIETMEALEKGKNTLAIFGTGRGKSAVFQTRAAYLALKENKATIIIYPLRALVNDQYLSLKKKLSTLGITVFKATGSLDTEEKLDFFQKLEQNNIDIILTTPEFLFYNKDKFMNLTEKLGLMVIDECHHLASRRSGYRNLPKTLEFFGGTQVLAVTATANDYVGEHIIENLKINTVIIDDHIRENLELIDARFTNDKSDYIKKLLVLGERTIVYVNSRNKAYWLATELRRDLPLYKDSIGYYHGGLGSDDRLGIENLFREGALQVIITTSAFGEGIDIPDIQNVVLFHLSFSKSEYNQLAGRAGRNGDSAKIHLLYDNKDQELNQFLLAGNAPNRQQMAQFYTLLKKIAEKTHPIVLNNSEIAQWSEIYKVNGLQDKSVGHWIGILEELGLIEREIRGNQRTMWIISNPPKVNLENSIRYLEGMDERAEYEDYLKLAYLSDYKPLKELICKPIFPKEYQLKE